MNKKLTAAALTGAAIFAPFSTAQADNVTIYGVADLGYNWGGDNIRPGVANRSAIDSGTKGPSLLGFRGTETIGDNLKAGFVLEHGIHADVGTFAGGGAFSRQSFVSLAGNFGTVALGRQYTPGYLLTSSVDPFGSVSVGQYNNVYLTEYRWDNQLSYTTPNWAGFSVLVGYTANGYGDESAGNEGSSAVGDVRALSVVPQYRNGPLFVGLHFQNLRARTTGLYDGDTIRVYDLGATYDFGVLKLAALYGVRRADNADFSPDTGASDGRKSRQWLIGATIPAGAAGKLQLSYTARRSTVAAGGSDVRANQWAVGYEHALSKRTTLYAVYADINNNGAAKDTANLFASVGAGYNPGNGYQRGASLGIQHAF